MTHADLIGKLCLGTAQFGLDYGISNMGGKISKEEISRILSYVKEQGIDTLDTSSAYGESESVIGSFSAGDFLLISKMSLVDFPGGDVRLYARDRLEKTLAALRRPRLYGYLVQHFASFRQHPQLWDALIGFKKEDLVRYIGFSLYKPEELEFLLTKKLPFDFLQIPYSVFDRRFEPYFSLLKERGIRIYARSVFLQGLIFLSPDKLTGSLVRAKAQLEKLQSIAKESGFPAEAICLNFPLTNPVIDKVIIGIDSLTHIQENIESLKMFTKVQDMKDSLREVSIADEDVLLPSRWQ